jgi:hypothetical protein
MLYSGMLRRVALGRTDISDERSDSIIGVIKIGELGTTSALTSKRSPLRRINIWYFSQRRLLLVTAHVVPRSPIPS